MKFDETNGSQNEQENLDDVRSDGLKNAMKNMSIGDVRPREEDEDEDGPSISIRVNPSTRSRITLFCEHYSFVSFL